MTVCAGLFLHFQFLHQTYCSRRSSARLMAGWAISKRSPSGKYSTPGFALFDSKKLDSQDRFPVFSIRMVNSTLDQGDGLKLADLFRFPPSFSSIIRASGSLTDVLAGRALWGVCKTTGPTSMLRLTKFCEGNLSYRRPHWQTGCLDSLILRVAAEHPSKHKRRGWPALSCFPLPASELYIPPVMSNDLAFHSPLCAVTASACKQQRNEGIIKKAMCKDKMLQT